jgi:hypothetical protein
MDSIYIIKIRLDLPVFATASPRQAGLFGFFWIPGFRMKPGIYNLLRGTNALHHQPLICLVPVTN